MSHAPPRKGIPHGSRIAAGLKTYTFEKRAPVTAGALFIRWKGGERQMANRMKFNSPEEMQEKIDQYFEECKGHVLTDGEGNTIFNKYGEPVFVDTKPLTVTGLALALGFTTRQALLNYQGRGAYKAIVEAAKLKIENYAEMRLYDKDGWNGARFNLQNNFRNWDADKAAPDDKKAPAINIICDIPRAPIQQDDDSKTAIDPLSVSEMLKDLERGKTDGGADE